MVIRKYTSNKKVNYLFYNLCRQNPTHTAITEYIPTHVIKRRPRYHVYLSSVYHLGAAGHCFILHERALARSKSMFCPPVQWPSVSALERSIRFLCSVHSNERCTPSRPATPWNRVFLTKQKPTQQLKNEVSLKEPRKLSTVFERTVYHRTQESSLYTHPP
jgi:hypothetical protein